MISENCSYSNRILLLRRGWRLFYAITNRSICVSVSFARGKIRSCPDVPFYPREFGHQLSENLRLSKQLDLVINQQHCLFIIHVILATHT